MIGKVKNINTEKGFGFIQGNDGNDYYFNEESLANDLLISEIYEKMNLEFEIARQREGKRSKAVNCRVFEIPEVKFFKEYALIMDEKKELYDKFCDNVKNYAERLENNKVTTSMIRKLYARILNARSVVDIKYLRPHFAYTSGRNDNAILREFMDLLDYLVKKMELDNQRHLRNFKDFMEAIVAYRKYVGKDN